jgi:hypothetical protein
MNVDATAACLLGTVDSFVRAEAYLGTAYNKDEVTDCIISLYEHGLSNQACHTRYDVMERR